MDTQIAWPRKAREMHNHISIPPCGMSSRSAHESRALKDLGLECACWLATG